MGYTTCKRLSKIMTQSTAKTPVRIMGFPCMLCEMPVLIYQSTLQVDLHKQCNRHISSVEDGNVITLGL